MDVQKEQEQQNRTDHVVSGFAFYSEKDARLAEQERQKIAYLDKRIDRTNLESVLVIYKKALDDRVFRTPVGLEYLRELQGELKAEQDHTKEILGNEYKDYNLVLATTFGMPIGASHVRTKMKQIIKKEGLPDVVFHSLRHTSVTYKLKLSGGDIKAVQGDSGHAQADMVTEVYGHILDEDRKKNAQLMENAFYNKENLNPDIHGASGKPNNNNNNMISVPEGVDADMLMKVLENPEMAALLTSLAKSMKG